MVSFVRFGLPCSKVFKYLLISRLYLFFFFDLTSDWLVTSTHMNEIQILKLRNNHLFLIRFRGSRNF